jgi:uncharacterized protein YbjT (DUF2867 family)
MILVIGSTGKIGTELLKALSAQGVKVKAAARTPDKVQKLPNVTPVSVDLAKRDSIRAALSGVDKMFLATSGLNQLEIESNAIEEAKAAGVKHLVKISVWKANDEKYAFAKQHRAIEKKIEALDVPHTFLRPNGFMQNFLGMGPMIAKGAFHQPLGPAKISHVDARDIAAVAAKVLTSDGHAGKAYLISGPEALSNDDIARTFTKLLNKTVRYVDVSPEDAKKNMVGMGWPPPMADAMLDLLAYYKTGAGADVVDTVKKIGNKTPFTLEQFIQDHRGAFS